MRVGIGDAALVRNLDDLEPEPGRVGLDDLAHLRVERLGEHDARAPGRMLRDVAGVGRDREAVVAGRVRHVHPGQLADRRLVLEDRLQDALAHLGLVRRVGGQELAALQDRVDDRRACGGRRCRRRGTRARRRCARSSPRAPRGAGSAPASVSAGGTSSSRSKRTSSGICSNRSSIDETPIAASISSRSRSVSERYPSVIARPRPPDRPRRRAGRSTSVGSVRRMRTSQPSPYGSSLIDSGSSRPSR